MAETLYFYNICSSKWLISVNDSPFIDILWKQNEPKGFSFVTNSGLLIICLKNKVIPGGAWIVGATGTGTPRPAARPTPVPGAALEPNNLALSCELLHFKIFHWLVAYKFV